MDERLTDLIDSLSDSPPAGPLVNLCKTFDQATALATLINTLADREPRYVINYPDFSLSGPSQSPF